MRRSFLASFLVIAIALAAHVPESRAATRGEIDAGVSRTLDLLERKVPGSYELISRAAGALVFPIILKAGLGVGGEYGEGALIRGRQTVGYYNTVSASVGFQLGIQSKAVVIVFMTNQALASFQQKNGWKVGIDGSVTLINVGVGGAIDTNQVTDPVIGFVLGTQGLMYNLTLEGSKISRINR